jgi:hypothetical protein
VRTSQWNRFSHLSRSKKRKTVLISKKENQGKEAAAAAISYGLEFRWERAAKERDWMDPLHVSCIGYRLSFGEIYVFFFNWKQKPPFSSARYLAMSEERSFVCVGRMLDVSNVCKEKLVVVYTWMSLGQRRFKLWHVIDFSSGNRDNSRWLVLLAHCVS